MDRTCSGAALCTCSQSLLLLTLPAPRDLSRHLWEGAFLGVSERSSSRRRTLTWVRVPSAEQA